MTVVAESKAVGSLVAAKPTTITPAPTKMQSPFTSTGQPGMQTGQQPYGTPTMQQVQGQMTGGLERMRDWLQNWIQNTADTLRVYVNQYPPLAAFLFTLLVLSAVPVSVYVIFGLVTSAIFLTIALVSFGLVEGFILLTSGGILMSLLGCIGLFTTIGFSVVSSIYLGYRGCSFVASNVWQAGGQMKESMRSSMQQQPGSGYQGGLSGGLSSGIGGVSGGISGGTSGATSS